jgi:hypothetical protein
MQSNPQEARQQSIERVALDWEEVARAQRRARVLRSQAFHQLFQLILGTGTRLRRVLERASAPANCAPAGAC